jgi:hypothetical protein
MEQDRAMATIGYYGMVTGQGQAAQTDEITNNGHTAVDVTLTDPSQLASLDSLYVVNESNVAFGTEYVDNLAAIAAAVSSGMNLIIFDRYVTDANTILPGASSIIAVRDMTDDQDVNIASGAPSSFTNGAAGSIDDDTLDGGTSSNHGYVELSSLPPGATPLLTTSDPTHIVAFTYPVGSGNVFYATIPLDYYSNLDHVAITPAEIDTLFGNLQDILCFANGTLITTARGRQPIEHLKAGDTLPILRGGTQVIRWISSSHVTAANLAQNPKLRPVRITAGALGNGLPTRDLLVSRQHRMLVRSRVAERMFGAREALISAIKLTALPGIYVDESVEDVEYFHILFDQHEIILAEGAASESLFTGPEALKSVPTKARAELMQLFPNLTRLDYKATSAAHIPSAKLQTALVARHLKNAKAVFA